MRCKAFTRLKTHHGTELIFLKKSAPYRILIYEKLVIDVFQAYSGHNRIILDIGSNVGGYSLLSSALGSTVYSVEMQPLCNKILRCNAKINNYSNIHIIEGFTTKNILHTPIKVNPNMCNIMSSVNSTGGRWPNGLLMKSHREMNWKKTVSVYPVNLMFPSINKFHLTKIDTEGSEIDTLLSLNWSKIDATIIEFQADAWKYNSITRDFGISVVNRFIDHKNYRIRSLFGLNSKMWTKQRLISFLQSQKNSVRKFLFF
tara:strand:- start:2948 stop:3721 length:774 start_codon:yes stop_codon:yes gene_type:complete